MSLHFRPLWNRLFPPFKPLEIALLEKLKSSLGPDAAAILEKRIATVNLVQRISDETNLYHVRGGKVQFDEAARFPLRNEVRLATIKFKTGQPEQTFSTTFWLVNGFLFSFETSPNLRKFLNVSTIQVESVVVRCDPMKAALEQEKESEIKAYIALGSNLGDSSEILEEAMSWLEGLSARPLSKSSLWQSSPVDCPPGSPNFVNAVVGLIPQDGETPESLLAKLQKLEKEFGRKPKKVMNEPRPLDLDLIAFGNETRATPELTLPHPRAHLRRFVLEPLAEIAPDLVLPGQCRAVKDLLRQLTSDEVIRKLGE